MKSEFYLFLLFTFVMWLSMTFAIAAVAYGELRIAVLALIIYEIDKLLIDSLSRDRAKRNITRILNKCFNEKISEEEL